MKIDFEKYTGHGTGYVIKGVSYQGEMYEIDTIVTGYSQVLPIKKEMEEGCFFDIASLTKFFTAIVIHKAIDKGLLKLGDKIKTLDDRFHKLEDVTIADLLAHKLEIWTEGYLGDAKSKEEFYQTLFSSRVKSKTRIYVDVHYIILSVILEKIYDMSFEEIVEKEINRVLGLKNTAFRCLNKELAVSNNYQILEEEVVRDVEPGMVHDNKARVASEYGISVGHAGIFTTTEDFLAVLISLIDNQYRLLSKESIEKMLEHDDEHAERPYNYGGTRYRNPISEKDEIPLKASDRSIIFSGYTGPIFLIDFEKRIIILVMTNVCHNSNKNRVERYELSQKMIEELYDSISLQEYQGII